MKSLDKNIFEQLDYIYEKNTYNKIISNAISNVGLKDASLNKHTINKHDFIFSDEIETPEITDQKRTGRCWIFAGLNMLRPHIAKKLKMDDFELSQNYLYFYDNMEKTNLFIQKIIDTKDKNLSDREVEDAFLSTPEDGGYFEYFYFLIKKYGLVPKNVMEETFHSEDSFFMFRSLEKSLKKIAMDIRKEDDDEKIEKLRIKALADAYNIFVKCLGKPVTSFDFKYYDKDDNYNIVENLDGKKFFEEYVGDFFDQKIRLINDPRKEYNRVYLDSFNKNSVDLATMEGLNLDMDTISKACQKSIKNGCTMWFACDIDIDSDNKSGVLDENLYNFDQTLVEVSNFDKALRIDSRYSTACHAMNLVGFDKKDKDINFWKIENSWGDEDGKKGFFSMTDRWFRENTFEIIIDKKFLSKRSLRAFEKEKYAYEKYDPLYRMLKKSK